MWCFYFSGGHVSGICETRVEPAAFRLLCEVNRNNTGGLSSVYSQVSLIVSVLYMIKMFCLIRKWWMKPTCFQTSFSGSSLGFRRGSSGQSTNTPSWLTGMLFDFLQRFCFLSSVYYESNLKLVFLHVLQGVGYEQVPQHPVSAQPDQISSLCKEVDKHQEIIRELLQGLCFYSF